MAIIVTLTEGEIQHALLEGGIRQANAQRYGRRDKFTCDPFDAWMQHINAAGSEIAVAKTFQRYWSGISAIRADDVYGLQVRTSKRNSLPIRRKDGDYDCHVFVTGRIPTFTIHGWMMGFEARQHREWLDDPGNRNCPAYFVPIPSLHPIEEILPEVF